MSLPTLLIGWYCALSLATFLMFGWDKLAARRGTWRTAESTLFSLSLLGGWPGGYLGRLMFRHKTRKSGFGAKLTLVALLNLGLLYLTIAYLGH
ncbi:DUF1294 domain-containing protein [Halomonas sp. McH1-25]|uniref:DUF1294 domain-containing protein n=1 Tax=unclassified Halomonas TaxID=2609666 RepID=UPI001EF5EAFA|nr:MULTISPECIES: DUF1294 domain-containing protein [unclassified Halomonas]MCG7602128.1 DUF1294 domain-containing protein [Halomonas sp. McH1-25]MCP1344415.1 DUF1294 domain-containing protein [Halomonas sp. FL8]MCP1362495.1 DUF1294 domain-containing protein [Halomonas sp. BBD45]MCP1364552.1 DUF1294 domain-containing protein [Halomonas sp. BBD48]